MSVEFHLLRPYWLLALIPLAGIAWFLLRRSSSLQAWEDICDRQLLKHLVQKRQATKNMLSLWVLFAGILSMIIALTGPTWSRYPVPVFKPVVPRVLVLDMSDAMLADDLKPDRLHRAKFKLHDLFKMDDVGQLGLIAYTSEAFIVSPLTDDADTIAALLSSLTTDIMPVQGQRLDKAINEAASLIEKAGYRRGEILVLTAVAPTESAISVARILAHKGFYTSVMPVIKTSSFSPDFKRLATAGDGELVPLQNTSADLLRWLNKTKTRQSDMASLKKDIPVWKDQGRWFLIPALLLLLPVFRRGWLQRLVR